MKPSPIQLLQVMLKHVRVELDPEHVPEDLPNPLTSVFTFDGVSIQTDFSLGEVEGQNGTDKGWMYFIALRALIDNLPNAEAVDQKFAPYKVDIAVEGVVQIPKGAEKLGLPEDIASVNGASILWSVIREQLTGLTSRMQAGPVMLPTVHFHDLKLSPPNDGTDGSAVPVAKRSAGTKTKRIAKA